MWEIFNNYDFFKYFPNKNKYIFAHLAEGPGGFMEATYNYRKNIMNSINQDLYYCITLKPTTMTSNSEGKFMGRLGQTFGRGRIIRSFILNETLIYPKFLYRPTLIWQNIVSRGT
jgi:hypothetical protein